MGFFDKLFRGGEQYPALEPDAPAAARVARVEGELRSLADKTRDRLEVVPGDAKAYVFVGKPPKAFGLVWFAPGEEGNLKSLMAEKKLDVRKAGGLVEALAEAYEQSRSEPRFMTELGGRTLVVTPSDRLANEVDHILERCRAS